MIPHSPIPNHNLVLPSSYLSTRTSVQIGEKHLPALRLRFTPHLKVPTPLISAWATGRSIEKSLSVLVPVGGSVEIGLGVDVESVLGTVREQGGEDEIGVARIVEERVVESIRKNGSTLGIETIQPMLATIDPPISPNTTSFPNPSPIHKLYPASALPIHQNALQSLIPAGHLYVYLTRLDISLLWTSPSADGDGAARQLDEIEGTVEEDDLLGELEANFGGMAVDWGEEVIIDDDLMGLEVVGVDSADITVNPVEGESSGEPLLLTLENGLPTWLCEQLDRIMIKLFKVHFIKRFPLIFDPGLLKIVAYTTPPPSLNTSLTTFITLSKRHHRPLYTEAKKVLKKLSRYQDTRLQKTIHDAVNLPEKKPSKSPAKRRRLKNGVEDQDSQSSHSQPSQPGSQSQSQPKGRYDYRNPSSDSQSQSQSQSSSSQASTSTSTSNTTAPSEDREERALEYLTRLRYELEKDGNEESVLARIMGEGMGRCVRGYWEIGKKKGIRGFRSVLVGVDEPIPQELHLNLQCLTAQEINELEALSLDSPRPILDPLESINLNADEATPNPDRCDDNPSLELIDEDWSFLQGLEVITEEEETDIDRELEDASDASSVKLDELTFDETSEKTLELEVEGGDQTAMKNRPHVNDGEVKWKSDGLELENQDADQGPPEEVQPRASNGDDHHSETCLSRLLASENNSDVTRTPEDDLLADLQAALDDIEQEEPGGGGEYCGTEGGDVSCDGDGMDDDDLEEDDEDDDEGCQAEEDEGGGEAI